MSTVIATFQGGGTDNARRTILWIVGLSLGLHLVLLLSFSVFSWPAKTDRPLSSYSVSLVTLPTEKPRPVASPLQHDTKKEPTVSEAKAAPTPPQQKVAPAPAVTPPAKSVSIEPPVLPVQKAVPISPSVLRQEPAPAPAPTTPKVASVRLPPVLAPTPPASSRTGSRSLMSDDALLPETPHLQGMAPPVLPTPPRRTDAPRVPSSTAKSAVESQSLANRVTIPEMTAISKPAGSPAVSSKPSERQQSFSQDLEKSLQSIPPTASVAAEKMPPQEKLAKAPQAVAVKPVGTIAAQQQSPGTNEYLARIQRKISEGWHAPPIDLSGKSYAVVIRFRVMPSGAIEGVKVETSSGNAYYDFAGERAVVLSAPLPPFPSTVKESSLDAHFTFTVGEVG